VTSNKGSGLQFWDTVYTCISEVDGARKVKSDSQVAMNKNSDPVQNFYHKGWLGTVTNSFLKLGNIRNESC